MCDGGGDRYVAYFIDIKYKDPREDPNLKGDILPKDMPGQLEFTTEVRCHYIWLLSMLMCGVANNLTCLHGVRARMDDFELTCFVCGQVSIWPNTFPYEDCAGTECYGTLL